jgi:hypothetical protein
MPRQKIPTEIISNFQLRCTPIPDGLHRLEKKKLFSINVYSQLFLLFFMDKIWKSVHGSSLGLQIQNKMIGCLIFQNTVLRILFSPLPPGKSCAMCMITVMRQLGKVLLLVGSWMIFTLHRWWGERLLWSLRGSGSLSGESRGSGSLSGESSLRDSVSHTYYICLSFTGMEPVPIASILSIQMVMKSQRRQKKEWL